MYRKLRSVHLCTGLFCLAFLLMYGVSAVQMAHRRWWPIGQSVTMRSVQLPAGLTDARVAAREIGIRGELSAVRASAGTLQFRIVRPGIVNQIEYSEATGAANVKIVNSGFSGLLNRIHHIQGMTHEYPLLNVWSAVLGVVSIGLLLLGGTGLYLWFRDHRERWTGGILLAAGGGLAASLIVWMR